MKQTISVKRKTIQKNSGNNNNNNNNCNNIIGHKV